MSKIRNGEAEEGRARGTAQNSFDLHWLFEIDDYFVIFAGLRSRTNVEAYIVLDCQPEDELQPLVVQSLVGERPRIVDMIGLSLENGLEMVLDLSLRKIGTGHDDAEIVNDLRVSVLFEDDHEKFLRGLGVASRKGENLHVSFRGKVELSVLEAVALRLRFPKPSKYRFIGEEHNRYLTTVWEIAVEDVIEDRVSWPPDTIAIVKDCGSGLQSPHGIDLADVYFSFGIKEVDQWLAFNSVTSDGLLFDRPLQFIEQLKRRERRRLFGRMRKSEGSIVVQLRNMNRRLQWLWECAELEMAVARAEHEAVDFQVTVLHSVGTSGGMGRRDSLRAERVGGLVRYARGFFEYSASKSEYGGWLVHGRREVRGESWNRLELVVTPVNRGEGGS